MFKPRSSSDTSSRATWRHGLRLTAMTLFAVPFFMAASFDGCQIFIGQDEPTACEVVCEFGEKTDLDGNTYGECVESDICIDLFPPPHRNPETGDCVQFADPCQVPTGWEACDGEEGTCVSGGQQYAAGDTFLDADGCNDCRCRADGEVVCDTADCSQECYLDGVEYAPGTSVSMPDGCNTCYCIEDGGWFCTEYECSEGCEVNGEFYNVGESFSPDGCNTCTCDASGEAFCTAIACEETCEYNGQQYGFNEQFPAGDGCNTCTCSGNGQVSCTEAECTDCLIACEFGFKHDTTGRQYCECREDENCIEIAPPPYFNPDDPSGQCIDFPSVCDIPSAFLPCEQAPVDCEGEVWCDAIPPTCDAGEVPSVEGGCWGPCVPESRCR